jgi:hypothetical protein
MRSRADLSSKDLACQAVPYRLADTPVFKRSTPYAFGRGLGFRVFVSRKLSSWSRSTRCQLHSLLPLFLLRYEVRLSPFAFSVSMMIPLPTGGPNGFVFVPSVQIVDNRGAYAWIFFLLG